MLAPNSDGILRREEPRKMSMSMTVIESSRDETRTKHTHFLLRQVNATSQHHRCLHRWQNTSIRLRRKHSCTTPPQNCV